MQAAREASFLKVQKRIEDIRGQYAQSQSQTFNILVSGDSGTGKTSLLTTCPRPVFVDSFDPGGSKTRVLQPLIASGDIIVDDRWERDSWKRPTAYRGWEKEFEERRSEGFFEHIGTYSIDSLTKMTDAMLMAISAAKGRSGKQPEIQDYLIQQLTTVDCLNLIMALPCNVLITGHIAYTTDELTGRMETGLLVAGKLSTKIPIMFDEHYIARVQEKRTREGTEMEYRLLTRNDGFFKAKSRIGGDAFDTFEEPDIKKLMQKAGRPAADKPPITSSEA
jgi:hypothetical protein